MRTESLSIHYRPSGPRILQIIYSIILFSSVISIFNLYNIGTGGDFRYYVDNGANIFNRINPYINDFRSGTFGPLTIYFFSKAIPESIIQFSFYFLNVLGIFSILYYFKSKLTFSSLVICFTLIIWSAPFREIVVDGQITGILYLLMFSTFLLLKRMRTASRYKINVFIAALLSAVAVDLKPHICLPIILFVGLAQRKSQYLVTVLLILISAHVFINIWLGSFTEMQWIQNLIGAQSSKNNSMWPEQYNIWPIFDYMFPGEFVFWKFVSLISMLVTLILLSYFSINQKEEYVWLIAASFSMVIPYSHLYSLTLLFSLILIRVLQRKIDAIGYLIIFFVLVPRYWTEPKNVLFLAVVSVIIFVFNLLDKKLSYSQNIKAITLAILTNVLIHFINDEIILNENLERSIICVQVVFLSILFFIDRKRLLQLFKK